MTPIPVDIKDEAVPREGKSSELLKLGLARDDDVGMVGTNGFGPLPNDGKLSLLRSGALVELFVERDILGIVVAV